MCWRSGWGTEITQVLAAHREAVQGVVHRFDHWLEMLIPDAELVDALYPDHVVEFKAACAHAPPPAAARCAPLSAVDLWDSAWLISCAQAGHLSFAPQAASPTRSLGRCHVAVGTCAGVTGGVSDAESTRAGPSGELLMEERAIPVTLVCHGPLADQCMAFVQTTAFGGMMGGVGPGSCGLDAH